MAVNEAIKMGNQMKKEVARMRNMGLREAQSMVRYARIGW